MSEKGRRSKGSSKHGGSDTSLTKKQNKWTVELTGKLRSTLDWVKRVTRLGGGGPKQDEFHVSSVHTSLGSLSSMEEGMTDGERKPLLDEEQMALVLQDLAEDDPYTKFPREAWKAVVLVAAAGLTLYLNTIALVLTHQRQPDSRVPLPDIFLDLFNPVDEALYAAEIIIIISFFLGILLILFHRFRYIVFRRCVFLVTVLYFLRIFTMYMTVFPTASPTYECSPKFNDTSVTNVLWRALNVLAGFGLSINGRHIYCGDYMYSGHTITLVLVFLFVQEYSPKSSWKWVAFHWFFWVMSTAGIVLILLSRGHYSIDIAVAYFFTTRMFWIYHTMANMPELKVSSDNNLLSRVWWYPIFQWLEGNVVGVLPRQYSLPWSDEYVEFTSETEQVPSPNS